MYSKDADRIGHSGKLALDRLKKGGRDWSDWRAVGEALILGRELAMDGAHTNRPKGRGYNQLFSQYLTHYKLDSLDESDRAKLLNVMEHLAEIEEWRQSLDWKKRATLNHPASVWRAWKKATMKPKLPKEARPNIKAMALNDEIVMLQKDKASLQAHVEELEQAREKPGSIAQVRSDYVQLLAQLAPAELESELNNLLSEVRKSAVSGTEMLEWKLAGKRPHRVAKKRKKEEEVST